MKSSKSKKVYHKLLWPGFILLVLSSLSYFWRGLFVKLGLGLIENIARIFGYILGVGLWLTLAWFVTRLLDVLVWHLLIENRLGIKVPRLVKDILKSVIYFVAILGIFSVIFGQSITGLLTASGLIGLIVGLAIKNVISDVFSGLALNLDKPFQLGEWVFLHDPTMNIPGKVTEITWRTTRFETDNNSILIVPNSKLCTMPITNYSASKMGNFELTITLDVDIPTERALVILTAAAKSAETVLVEPPAAVSICSMSENGVVYRVSYWIEPAKSTPPKAKHAVIANIIKHLSMAGITLAIPKQTLFHAELKEQNYAELIPSDKLLEQVDLFNSLSEGEKITLTQNLQCKKFNAGSIVVELGDVGDSMFILAEGLLNVLIRIPEIDELECVAYITTGHFFGEMSLLTGEPRSARITAETDVVVYEITKAMMEKVFLAQPEVPAKISEIIAKRHAMNLRKQNEVLAQQNVEEHVESFASQLLSKIKEFFKL